MINKKFSGIKIAFFEPTPDIATNPSLTCIINEFTKNGAIVDVFMPDYGIFTKLTGEAFTYPFPRHLTLWTGDIRSTVINWRRFLLENSVQGHRIIRNSKYDLAFGINDDGIIAAYSYSKKNNTPFIYVSFELVFTEEISRKFHHVKKRIEIKASHSAKYIIIQDKWRGELLARANNLSGNNFLYLPVAPNSNYPIIKSDFLRKKFQIPQDKYIVLHSGAFNDWTYASELIENSRKWPYNFVLVIHINRFSQNNMYVDLIKKKELNNVFVSIGSLDNKTYEKMVCSADIGLALYKTNPNSRFHKKNIQTIGLSSGKFSYYMKYGLPVISIRQETYEEILNDYDFGFNIKHFDEMPESLINITRNYNKYSTEAKRLFSEKLTFDLHWPTIENKCFDLTHNKASHYEHSAHNLR